jgi:hypothetical protein
MKKECNFSKGKRGEVIPQVGKTRITIYLDDGILERFKAQSRRTGKGSDVNQRCAELTSRCDGEAPYGRDGAEDRARRACESKLKADHWIENDSDWWALASG